MKCWTGWSRDRRKVHRGLRCRTPAETRLMLARGPEGPVQENFADEEGSRGNWAWQALRDRTIRCCQYTQPLLLSVVLEECVRAHTWAPWKVAAFSGTSSLCPWQALGSGNTWVARVGFPGESVDWRWAGAAEGEDSEGSSCSTGSRASVCRGLDLWRSWCRRPSVASPDKGVLPGRCLEDGRHLWTHRETVGAVCANGSVSAEVAWTRNEVVVGSIDFRNPFVSFVVHIVVLLLVCHHHWNAAPNFVTSCWVGKGSSFLWAWVWGAWRVTVGLHADVGEGHFPSGCCGCYRPFHSWCYTRCSSARVNCGCIG